MSEAFIKQVYDKLIDNWADYHKDGRTFTVPGWYKNYKQLHSCCVMPMRHRLKVGYRLDPNKDESFLRWLIYEQQNSISNSGMSYLSLEDYKSLINEPSFMDCLSQFMIKPNAERLQQLGDTWNGIQDINHSNRNQLRVCRVAAACTTRVASTVDTPKFDAAYKYFSNNGIVLSKTAKLDRNNFSEWYVRNEELMTQLHKIFKVQISNGTTDAFWLSIFVWEVYQNKNLLLTLSTQQDA